MSSAHPPKPNPNFKKIQDLTATAYITNFSTTLGSKDLWQLCEKHGTVADVYIARKLSKVGCRFAFVRFLKVNHTGSLIEALNKIWIGSYHIFAAMARFERNSNATQKQYFKPPTKQPSSQPKSASASSHANPNRSYATALNGKTTPNPTGDKFILKSVTLDSLDLINTSGLNNVVLVKVRDVHLILNINNVLKKEGLNNVVLVKVRDVHLILNINNVLKKEEFNSLESCKKIQANSEMSWYFTAMKQVSHSFIADERVIWVEIGGLSLNAWTTKAFKKIANIWGEPLSVNDDPLENVAVGRVCIRTRIQGHISKTCNVMIQPKSHKVWVKEFAGWIPDIKAMESTSSKSSESDTPNNEDSKDKNGELHGDEEGEIPMNEEIETDDVVEDT
nr:RNA-directed DNA polymerase, eukaryota [Tanacetum cinerariifolium]